MSIPHGTLSGYSYHKCRCDQCVVAKKAKDRAYYLANTEARKAKAREYYASNKDKAKETGKRYREAHRDEHKAYMAEYAKKNSSRLVAKSAEWVKNNPERRKKQQAKYRMDHKEQIAAYNRQRFQNLMATDPERIRKQARDWAKTPRGRASYMSAQNRRRRDTPYTKEALEWMVGIDWSTELCTYCPEPATEIDHILPITRGGDGSRDNLTPCCRSCNARKGNRYLADFLGFVEPERMAVYA